MSTVHLARMDRTADDGCYETLLRRAGGEELFLTAQPQLGESLEHLLSRLVERIGPGIVEMTIINGGSQLATALRVLGDVPWPITWLDSEGVRPAPLAGVEIHAVRGPSVTSIRQQGRVVGCAWEDGVARHCVLGDLRDANTATSPTLQTQHVFDSMTAALASAELEFQHVYRTWFRNHHILSWYPDFNHVRTEFYQRLGVFEGVLPASTGISAANPFGAALVASLWAIQPKVSGVGAATVPSPLQDSACKYGSAFSRAVEVDLGDHRRLTISGTASIDATGRTVHRANAADQVYLTMEVVGAILRSRGMDWHDLTRGIAYFRDSAEMGTFARWCAAHGVSSPPVILSEHTVCREDLLFEIEVDACK